MARPAQFKTLAALWLVLAVIGPIFVIVYLRRTAGSFEGITASGLVAFFSSSAIAVAAPLGLLLRKRWGLPLAILLSAIVLIMFVPNTIGNLVELRRDVDVGITSLIGETVLLSAYGLWVLVPGKGREVCEEHSRP